VEGPRKYTINLSGYLIPIDVIIYRVITNDVSYYIHLLVRIAHIIYNHTLLFLWLFNYPLSTAVVIASNEMGR